MIKKFLTILVLFVILLHPQTHHAEGYQHIEIFDPTENKVVKVVETNKDINDMVVGWINGIDGFYSGVDPIKDDGYAIKFPINPSIQVQNQWLKTTVNEVYLITPKNNPTFFLVLETEDNLVSFPFKDDISKLSNILDFKLR